MRVSAVCLVVLLCGCTDRPELVLAPDAIGDAPTRTIFVATSRGANALNSFGTDRANGISYASYDVSMPPNRQTGVISAGNDIDPETDFLVKSRKNYPGGDVFSAELSREIAQTTDREAVIYIHGFNNTFDEGVLRIAQISQDFDVPGVPLHYSWPSAGNVFGYAFDRDSVLYARDGLDQLIDRVLAARPKRISIIAHSLGSHLAMEVLRQRAIANPGSVARDIDAILLISPDIDVTLFRTQAKRIGKLPSIFAIFVSQKDRALALSARLTGQRDRLGNASAGDVSDLDVTVIDVTAFSKGVGHFTTADSESVISLFQNPGAIAAAFDGDSAGRVGLLPGSVLTVQSATEIILSPLTELAQ